MATITKSIGTSGRDYSTITLWEADLDNTTPYDAGDVAIGECYDDSAFDEAVTINGGGTIVLTSVRLGVEAGSRTDGTAGTGARIVKTVAVSTLITLVPAINAGYFLTVEDLELDGNQVAGQATMIASNGAADFVPRMQRMILHGVRTTTAGATVVEASTRDMLVQNCVLYDHVATGDNRSVYGAQMDADQAAGGLLNNTIHGILGDGTGAGQGVSILTNSVNGRIRNNIVIATSSSGAGAASSVDFAFAGSGSVTSSNNLSGDATADNGAGSGHLINQTVADLFVSTTAGSEDFHLKAGSPAINTGADLVTTPDQVNLDLVRYDRDTGGGVWDIGCLEYIEPPASASLGRAMVNRLRPAIFSPGHAR